MAASRSADHDSPDPIEHAAPDVELAEAQLAVGRPEMAIEDEPPEQAALDEAEFEREEDEADATVPGVLPDRPASRGRLGEWRYRRRGRRNAAASECSSGVSSTSFREAGASSNEYSGLIVGR